MTIGSGNENPEPPSNGDDAAVQTPAARASTLTLLRNMLPLGVGAAGLVHERREAARQRENDIVFDRMWQQHQQRVRRTARIFSAMQGTHTVPTPQGKRRVDL